MAAAKHRLPPGTFVPETRLVAVIAAVAAGHAFAWLALLFWLLPYAALPVAVLAAAGTLIGGYVRACNAPSPLTRPQHRVAQEVIVWPSEADCRAAGASRTSYSVFVWSLPGRGGSFGL